MLKNSTKVFIATMAIYLAFAAIVSFHYDFTKLQIVGDEASHLLQALSIANGMDLKYDHHDEVSWQRIGWEKYPRGLFFQEYSHGYAFAKPYGYSLYLSIFLALFGKSGVMLANFSIYLLLGIFQFLTFREKYSTANSIKLLLSFCLFSYVYFYIFFIHSDLFLAMLSSSVVYLFVKYIKTHQTFYIIPMSIIAGFLVADKIVFIIVLAPLAAYIFFKHSRLATSAVACATFIASFFVFIIPYLHYSDYSAWNAYSGERFYAASSVPFFSGSPEVGIRKVDTGQHFTKGQILGNIFKTDQLNNRFHAVFYYCFGSLTGMLFFIPMAFITIVSSLFFLGNKFNSLLCVSLFSVLSYLLFYCWLFPDNYAGGYSLGNRYFLQIFPFLALLFYAHPYQNYFINASVGASFVISAVFLYHHHLNPSRAHFDVSRASVLQSVIPFEKNQPWLVGLVDSRVVNNSLYPRIPTSRRIEHDLSFDVEGKSFFVKTANWAGQSAWFSGIKDDQVLEELFINGFVIFADNGFFHNENTHVWSKKYSRLFMKPNQGRIRMELVPLIKGTRIDVTANCDVTKSGDGSYALETDSASVECIQIVFSADKSGIPNQLDKNSTDGRDLSFRLTLR